MGGASDAFYEIRLDYDDLPPTRFKPKQMRRRRATQLEEKKGCATTGRSAQEDRGPQEGSHGDQGAKQRLRHGGGYAGELDG